MHKQTVMLQNIVGTGVLDGPLQMQRLTVNVVLFEDRRGRLSLRIYICFFTYCADKRTRNARPYVCLLLLKPLTRSFLCAKEGAGAFSVCYFADKVFKLVSSVGFDCGGDGNALAEIRAVLGDVHSL